MSENKKATEGKPSPKDEAAKSLISKAKKNEVDTEAGTESNASAEATGATQPHEQAAPTYRVDVFAKAMDTVPEMKSPPFKIEEKEEMLKEGRKQYPESVLRVFDVNAGNYLDEMHEPSPKEEAKAPEAAAEVDVNEGYPVYPKDDPAKAKETHEARVRKYGSDYIVATKGKFQSVWSQLSWDRMDGSRNGWAKSVVVPRQVLEHQRNKK